MSTQVCTTVASNTDILGIGIRVNFYYTMLLLAVIPKTTHTGELLNALYANAGIAGLGLLLAAIVQTAQGQLSLFYALFIVHILFFLGTGASPLGKYHWTKGRVVMGVMLQFASVAAFTGWALYIWADVNHFGSRPECNDRIKYVIFFVTIRATVPWLRGVWIAALVLSALGLMLKFGLQASMLFATQNVVGEGEAEETTSITRRLSRGSAPGSYAEEVKKPWYLQISIPLLLSAIYSTIMLELTVHRNMANLLPDGTNIGPGVVQVDNSWGFGQILSVVMIIANLNEVINFLFGFFARRRRSLAREHQVEAQEAAFPTEERSGAAPYRPRGPSASNRSIRNGSQDKIASGLEYELENIKKWSAQISETTVEVDSGTQSHDQPVGTLR